MFLYCEQCNKIYSTFDRTVVVSDNIRTNLETGDVVADEEGEYIHSTTYSCFNCSDGDNLLQTQQDRFKLVWYQVITITEERREVINMFKQDDVEIPSSLEYIDLDELTAAQLLLVKKVFDI